MEKLDEVPPALSALFEKAAIGLAIVAPDGHWLHVNRELCQIVGYTKAEMLTLSVQDLTHPDDLDHNLDLVGRMLARDADSFSLEKRCRRKDGSVVWVDITVTLVWRQDGTPDYFVSVVRDISTAVQQRQQARLWTDAFRNAQLGLVVNDARTNCFAAVNPEFARRRGYSVEELVGKPIQTVIPPERTAEFHDLMREFQSRDHLVFETEQQTRDGQRFPVLLDVTVVRDSQGVPDKRVAIVHDLTTSKQVAEALWRSQTQLRLLVEHAPAALAMFDRDMRCLVVSRRWLDDYGLKEDEVIGRSHYDVFPEIGESWKAVHRRALAGEAVSSDGECMVRQDGRIHWLRWEVRPWYEDKGQVGGVIMFSEDISSLKQGEDQLRITARIFDRAGEAIIVTGPDGIIQTVNSAFSAISGYTWSEAVGQRTTLLKSGRHSPEFYRAMWHSISTVGFWQGEIWNRRKSGEIYPEWLTINRITNDKGEIEHFVAVFSDISEVKDSQRKAEYLATHDPLTTLPNRALFQNLLEHGLAKARREKQRLALLFIDLDNFKTINDTLGHAAGDEMLIQAAARLRQSVRDVDTVARLGGDEFTAIVSGCTTESAGQVANRIVTDLSAAYAIQGQALHISTSVGIAFYPDDGSDAQDLLKAADAAVYRAKELGRNRVEFYLHDLQDRLLRRVTVERALRQALVDDRLRLAFQPKVSLMTQKRPIVGAEALLRWNDPALGNVSPGEFIPIAESSGLILDVGRATQKLLLRQLADWQRQGLEVPPVAINVSPRSMREEDFGRQLIDEIHRAGVPHASVQIEITEGALLENSNSVVNNLNVLADAGIKIAIDDFGTGYSSLSYLKHLPLAELKIDKSFVDGLGQDREDEAIARAVLALALALELRTVAEGVETRRQLDWLEAMGCNMVQGYYFFRPLEADQFRQLLAEHAGA